MLRWGVDDRYDWYVDGNGSLRQGHDLLFDGGEPTAPEKDVASDYENPPDVSCASANGCS